MTNIKRIFFLVSQPMQYPIILATYSKGMMMNQIYKIVSCQSKGVFEHVSEIESYQGQGLIKNLKAVII